MQANLADHLSPHVLSALGAGRLHAAAAADVVAHLDTCAECRQAGTALMGDSFLLRLHAARPPAGTVVEPLAPADTAGAGPSPDQGSTTRYTAPAVLPELRDHPQYEVLRELGRGGMGVVYLAKNKMMDRPEVLKVVNKQLLGHPEAAERFLREIRSAARLSHPNIVTAYSALQAGDLLAFAMEYIEGENLEQFVQAQGRLPVANACYYTSQVALGLQHAFEKGLVHRDIKPQNLILAREGKKHVVKVLDFGLAKATREGEEADRGLTGTGMMMGTPDYIAPEQTLDAARADIRADIYSLGCTLYYLLTGSPPFKGRSQFELLQAHHSKEATPLNQLRPDVPAALAAVVAKMMAKEPAGRYQKPVEVAQALAPFVKAGTRPLPPAPVVAAEAVIENNATSGRATKQTAAKPARQGAAAPAPMVQGTVMEGSATIARAQKKTDPGQPRHDTAVPVVQGPFIEGTVARATRPAAAPRARPAAAKRSKVWLRLAVLLVGAIGLCAVVLFLLKGTHEAGTKNGAPEKVTRENFNKLTVGMPVKEVEAILGAGKANSTPSEVAEAFGAGPEELSRKARWIAVAKKKLPVYRWTEGDKIILTCVYYKDRDHAEALCYSSTSPGRGRVSEDIGSLPLHSKVRKENFDTLTVGMTRTQVDERLGKTGLTPDPDEFIAALGAMPGEQNNKEAWRKAFNERKVAVYTDGVGTRILVGYSGPDSFFRPTAVAFYYSWTGLDPSDRLSAEKGSLSSGTAPAKPVPFPAIPQPPRGFGPATPAKPRPLPVATSPLGMKFVRVRKGTFWMGWDSVGKKSKRVTISADFELAAYTVTQAQWQELMGNNPSWFSRQGQGKQAVQNVSDADLKRFPVESVSWNDVQDFLRKLNAKEKGRGWVYGLPTEAAWEYACRGGATSKAECSFDFYLNKPSNDLSWGQANFDSLDPAGNGAKGPKLYRTTKVGSYRPNKLGLYDMHGNVWQWCNDLFAIFASDQRVIRGGSWFREGGQNCRAAVRFGYAPSKGYNNLGFRVARAPSGSE